VGSLKGDGGAGEGEDGKTKEESTKAKAVEDFKQRQKKKKLPEIENIVNVYDLQRLAQKMMTKENWDYYISGADDEITLRENEYVFQRIWLKPRVLINVTKIDTTSKILGIPTSMPIYLTATALTKLAHPEGDLAISKAAQTKGLLHMVPILGSCPLEEIHNNAKTTNQPLFFQLYMNENREMVETILRRVKECDSYKAICVTVDAPVLGRRERDIRNRLINFEQDKNTPHVLNAQKIQGKGRGYAQSIAFTDPSLHWEDLEWIRSITNLPIVLKGVQTGEDAILAVKHNVSAIILSNHGGRQLDYARSSIEVLEEVTEYLKRENLVGKIEIWVDGGIRRGTDIFKAIALGATAVGIGRSMLFGLASYGQEGVEKVVDLLREELVVCMTNMGTPSIQHINSSHILRHNLHDHFLPSPTNFSSEHNYSPLLSKL
jgi:L-lactate dehydrogenase (cytochrome)